jgi:hypothetical protein
MTLMKIIQELIMLAAVAILGYIAWKAFNAWLAYKKTTNSLLSGAAGAASAASSAFDNFDFSDLFGDDGTTQNAVASAKLPNQPYYDSFIDNATNPYDAALNNSEWNFSPQ